MPLGNGSVTNRKMSSRKYWTQYCVRMYPNHMCVGITTLYRLILRRKSPWILCASPDIKHRTVRTMNPTAGSPDYRRLYRHHRGKSHQSFTSQLSGFNDLNVPVSRGLRQCTCWLVKNHYKTATSLSIHKSSLAHSGERTLYPVSAPGHLAIQTLCSG